MLGCDCEGLPAVNGTYEFQKEYSKQFANDLCELINIIHINGFSHAQNNIKASMGIRGHVDKIIGYSDPKAVETRERSHKFWRNEYPDVDPSV